MKMNDHMKLPVSGRFSPDFDDVSWHVVAHAINQHDKLVKALSDMIWYIDVICERGNDNMVDRAREVLKCESE